MVQVELTQDEVEVVDRYRKQKAIAAQEREYTTRLLRVAAEYYKFMIDNQVGSSYSTFTDEFGYESPHGVVENRSALHEQCLALISAAREFAQNSMMANRGHR